MNEETQEYVSDEDNSMRDDLNAALEEAGGDYEESVQEVIGEEIAPSEPSETEEQPTEASTPDPVQNEAESAPKAEDADNKSTKAPIDWTPKEREDWSKIPRHLQDKIKQRENDTANLMNETAQARQTHGQFTQLANTYGAVLSGVAGNTPMEAVENLFSTVANLRMGNPIQKAQIISDLVSDYGVDIHALDAALTGTMPAQDSNAHLESMIEQRMAPVNQFLQSQQQSAAQQQQQVVQAAQQEVGQFSQTAEFFQDVRNDMADLVEMASSRGVHMSMDDAYSKACALNPQIQGVLAERTKHQQLTGGRNSMESKRRASSGLSGGRIGNDGASGGLSMRQQIANAWDGADE